MLDLPNKEANTSPYHLAPAIIEKITPILEGVSIADIKKTLEYVLLDIEEKGIVSFKK